MHHNAMPRKASIRKSRPAPLSSASSPTNGLEVTFRSLISFLQTGKMGRCWSFGVRGHTPRLMILLKLQASMKEASLEVLKRCRKSYEISQIFAEAPKILDSVFD